MSCNCYPSQLLCLQQVSGHEDTPTHIQYIHIHATIKQTLHVRCSRPCLRSKLSRPQSFTQESQDTLAEIVQCQGIWYRHLQTVHQGRVNAIQLSRSRHVWRQ